LKLVYCFGDYFYLNGHLLLMMVYCLCYLSFHLSTVNKNHQQNSSSVIHLQVGQGHNFWNQLVTFQLIHLFFKHFQLCLVLNSMFTLMSCNSFEFKY